MTTPRTCFLDTSILAGQQYNFASIAFTSFAAIAKESGLRLLLPDPTSREVLRQIRERSDEALKAHDTARRRAPFLAKWKHYPNFPQSSLGDWEVKRIANAEWTRFLAQFEVVRLGYEDIKVSEIMDWYDATRAPFADGKKRKEFPDAFAVAILDRYAQKNGAYVAVVSADGDFKRACSLYPSLLYFPSLPSLTELLLGDVAQIAALKELIEHATSTLEEAVIEATSELGFYHSNEQYKDIEDVGDLEYSMRDFNVVALGVDSCTITFSCILSYGVRLSWEEPSYYDRWDRPEYESARVSDEAALSGTAKLQLGEGLSSIEEISFLKLDDEEIEVTTEPS